jgi:putative phosphoesterase
VAAQVAVISDVHGNAPALAAVLDEVARDEPELVVFGGDLTWGPLPGETLDLVRKLETPALFVRGNADRAVLEGVRETDREQWMQDRHSPEARAFLESFAAHHVVDVAGLGAVRFCHGSPRSDEECVTPETPVERVREFSVGVDEHVIVTAHVHLQFDREVDGVRSVSPGSVGLPYQGRPGAYWALLGPDVDLRRTEYDVAQAIDAYRRSGFPNADELTTMLLEPPSPAEVIEHAERVVFAG